jgi:hypothetical protein
MWSDDPKGFATRFGITASQAKALECTGEHLEAHTDGGSSSKSNIVAACKFCNQGRHRRKTPPSPDQFKQIVLKRMAKMRWHSIWIFEKVLHA